ncbi:MAG: succinate dehydrogenase cytochrome B558 [Candidatus Sumerlaeia bacterium]
MLFPNERQFWIRRLHSLLGVVPLGVFLAQHLAANSLSVFGQQKFNSWVAVLQQMPLVWVLEWGLIFLPMLAHGILGLVYLRTAQYNTGRFGYLRNYLYTLQRLSGIVVFFFVLYHVVTLTFLSEDYKHDFYSLLYAMFQDLPMCIVYLLGVTATVYHFSNGLATFCITWGLTISVRSQKMMLGVALVVGILLMAMAVVGIIGFRYGAPPMSVAVR